MERGKGDLNFFSSTWWAFGHGFLGGGGRVTISILFSSWWMLGCGWGFILFFPLLFQKSRTLG